METDKTTSQRKRGFMFTYVPVYLSTSSRFLLWLLPLSFLIIAFFYPLARIFALTLDPAALTAQNLLLAARVLLFTFYQATLSTLLTLLLGLPSAYLFARYDFRGKSLLRALTAVPFMLPTVVVASSFNAIVGPRGLFSFLFPLSQDSFLLQPSPFILILIAHVFYNTTIIIRVVGNALSSLDPKLEAAARSLGADSFRVWWHVTFPLLRPALLASSLLVFLFDFTSFGVVLLLGGAQFATLEVEIYLRVLRLPNLHLAALLSVIQLLCTILFSVLYSHFASRSTIQTAPRSAESNLRKLKTLREKIYVTAFVFLLTSFFLLPLSALPIRSLFRVEADRGQRGEVQYGFTTDYYSELFVNRRGSVFYVPPIQATVNSLGYAAATVILSLLLGFPAAFALARPTRLERILDPLIMLPLGSSTVIALPFVIRVLQPAIASIPQRLRQAASSLGASPWNVWKNIDLPILRRATLAAATFAFTISLGEFGATLLISRPEYPTIPVAIERFLSQPGGLNYGQAMAMATILMLLTLASILLIEKFRLPGSGEF
jgi:thiamine transport system permease protein